jgi:hypothetical protein
MDKSVSIQLESIKKKFGLNDEDGELLIECFLILRLFLSKDVYSQHFIGEYSNHIISCYSLELFIKMEDIMRRVMSLICKALDSPLVILSQEYSTVDGMNLLICAHKRTLQYRNQINLTIVNSYKKNTLYWHRNVPTGLENAIDIVGSLDAMASFVDGVSPNAVIGGCYNIFYLFPNILFDGECMDVDIQVDRIKKLLYSGNKKFWYKLL